jgi:hypothetical protein
MFGGLVVYFRTFFDGTFSCGTLNDGGFLYVPVYTCHNLHCFALIPVSLSLSPSLSRQRMLQVLYECHVILSKGQEVNSPALLPIVQNLYLDCDPYHGARFCTLT